MNLTHEQNVILNVLKQKPNLGKTAVMKIVFMLQQVKDMDLSYEYSIYTYGPYSSEVTEDVDTLISEGLIISSMYPYQNYVGYELALSSEGTDCLEPLVGKEQNDIDEILNFTEGKTAKQLELYSTIIHVYNLYQENDWGRGIQVIVDKVNEIKPHFDKEAITQVYNELIEKSYLKSKTV